MRHFAELLQGAAHLDDAAERVPRQHRQVVDQLVGTHPRMRHPRVRGQLHTADRVVRPRLDAAGVHACLRHPPAQHHREHAGDDLLAVGDHLVLARRVVRHHEPVRLGFGGHRMDVDPDDLAGQVVAVEVRRQRSGHVRDQRGLREAHHHRGGEVVLVHEIAVKDGLGHPDLGGDLVHADVAATPANGHQCAIYQLISALHLVLVPAPFASIGLYRHRRNLLCHYRASPFPRSTRYYGEQATPGSSARLTLPCCSG